MLLNIYTLHIHELFYQDWDYTKTLLFNYGKLALDLRLFRTSSKIITKQNI